MTQHDRDDTILRAAFVELRARHEQSVPSLDAIIARAPHPASRFPHPASLAIAAALVIVAVGFYQVLSHKRERLTVPNEIIALSAWRPATEVLLDASTQTLLTQTPQLNASTLDIPGDPR